MDAPEDDQDVKLQRASHELLGDLQASLEPFVWKSTRSAKRKIRRRVRVRETDRLVALLEPFQENPQLLDPHLQSLIPPLADAFVASLTSKPPSELSPKSQLLMTTSRAICRLIYTFCKVRGEKVIVRFLSTEAKHLEMLLLSIETHREHDKAEESSGEEWDWEERYIALLWLSQLLFAPFDLASISSQGLTTKPVVSTSPECQVAGLQWPLNVPSIALRTIPLAIHYLSTSGKERDAAKVLLVRVAMRKDMQELGVMQALIRWAISRLRTPSDEESSYYYIGILSFIAGILKSSMGTADADSHLSVIFSVIQHICSSDDEFSRNINASPVIRQTSVNILRNISVLLLRSTGIPESSDMVEWTIGYFLDSLGDSATPVRIATSKALSVITLKLAPEMAEQVIDELLSSLKRDLLPSHVTDFSTVNPLEWHGLILTLSQLLYRRAPPMSQLSLVIASLIDGVNFEQRSTSGSSVGTNVRDAANLGIWAIARRYTTNELQSIPVTGTDAHVLQKLATVLVVSASLDPAGNIRRGSSAALQELVGRHPNTIAEGIQLVQTIEYSSVALRSKAMQDVAVNAAVLDPEYAKSLLEGLQSWRGVGDPDVSARRTAAKSFGNVACGDMNAVGADFWDGYCNQVSDIELQLQSLKQRQVDKRHGLILCLAEIVTSVECALSNERGVQHASSTGYPKKVQAHLREVILLILENTSTTTYRRPELIAEAVCHLLIPTFPLLGVGLSEDIDMEVNTHDDSGDTGKRTDVSETRRLFDLADRLLEKWLRRSELEVIDFASKASFAIFSLRSDPQRQATVSSWINIISEDQGSRSGQDIGVLTTLFRAYRTTESFKKSIMEATRTRWNMGHDIESRIAILQCFYWSRPFEDDVTFTEIAAQGLDDYTTDTRGDIGSLVRTEALRAARAFFQYHDHLSDDSSVFNALFPKVLRLAAEKLDKIRNEAQNTIAAALRSDLDTTTYTRFQSYSPSSKEYFRFLLDLPHYVGQKYPIEWQEDLIEGYISSADTGSEDLVRASRAALAEYCETSPNNLGLVCTSLLAIMKRNLKKDRILVPVMEVMAFLFDYQIMQCSSTKSLSPFHARTKLTSTSWRTLYALVQNAHYQSGNIRKLEAAVKLYGGLVDVYPEATQKLSGMLLHKYPKVRNEAADAVFTKTGKGKSLNWARAKQADLIELRKDIYV